MTRITFDPYISQTFWEMEHPPEEMPPAEKKFDPAQPRDRHGKWTHSAEDMAAAAQSGFRKLFEGGLDLKRLGRCYELAGQYVIGHPDTKLVHGSIQGMGRPRLNHAWAQLPNGDVWEPASNTVYTRAEFQVVFSPQVHDTYTWQQAAQQMDASGTYGPWKAAKWGNLYAAAKTEDFGVYELGCSGLPANSEAAEERFGPLQPPEPVEKVFWPPTARGVLAPRIMKVGPEGYIHGWICVRPPCGPKHGPAEATSIGGAHHLYQVTHNGENRGKLHWAGGKWWFEAASDGATGPKVRTRAEALQGLVHYHDARAIQDEVNAKVGNYYLYGTYGDVARHILAGRNTEAADVLRKESLKALDNPERGRLAKLTAAQHRQLREHTDWLYQGLTGGEKLPPAAGPPPVPKPGAGPLPDWAAPGALTLVPLGGGTVYDDRTVPTYEVKDPAGHHIAWVVPQSRGQVAGRHDVGFFGHIGDGFHTPLNDDPEGAAKDIVNHYNMQLLATAARKAGLPSTHFQIQAADRFLTGAAKTHGGITAEEAAADKLREAQERLTAEATGGAKGMQVLDTAMRTLYRDLTGEDMPNPVPAFQVPDEPWAKTGKIATAKQLDVKWRARVGAPGEPLNPDSRIADVTHTKTGVKIGTLSYEYIKEGDPRNWSSYDFRAMEGPSFTNKRFYQARHADGSVAYFGPSADNAVGALRRMHNAKLGPRPPVADVAVPGPAEPPAGWEPHLEVEAGVTNPAEAHAEIMDAVTRQARYIPAVTSRSSITVRRHSARLGSSGGRGGSGWALGMHWASGKVEISEKNMASRVGTEKSRELLKHEIATRWWVPAREGALESDATVAHELGHGVAARLARYGHVPGGPETAPMWKAVADGIGIPAPQLDWSTRYDLSPGIARWISQFKGKVAKEVSRYGSTDPAELLAELWSEYTMSPDPRPAAKAYGDWVMKNMTGRATDIKPKAGP